jgi:hypothetical protein
LKKTGSKAEALGGNGKIDEAIDLVQGGIRSSRCERDSFRRSIAGRPRFCSRRKQPDIAVSVLEMVDRKATDYNIGVPGNPIWRSRHGARSSRRIKRQNGKAAEHASFTSGQAK